MLRKCGLDLLPLQWKTEFSNLGKNPMTRGLRGRVSMVKIDGDGKPKNVAFCNHYVCCKFIQTVIGHIWCPWQAKILYWIHRCLIKRLIVAHLQCSKRTERPRCRGSGLAWKFREIQTPDISSNDPYCRAGNLHMGRKS